MPQAGSRKRAAPGASPMVQQAPTNVTYSLGSPTMQSDHNMRWNQENGSNATSSYPDPSGSFSPTNYNTFPQPAAVTSEPSNQLTRSNLGNRLVTGGAFNNGDGEAWTDFANDTLQQPREEGWMKDDDNLEQRALVAKREAQGKRKLIPPFIQKLSSFLDESRNTDLIRWSTSGDSFIVVDEDEFAKTLIPELFKHNNYASFVRQLNMYGFHKKVGLSDNSMRASEKKNKSPSEYYNPFFKRGRPSLLWLIQKPKPSHAKGKGGNRGKQDDAALDDTADDTYDVDSPVTMNHGLEDHGSNQRNGRQPLLIGQGTGSNLPDEEMADVQRELQTIRRQQRMITAAIHKIRRDNEQQAAQYQELHNKHENSINAILTFLATIYNRSLEAPNAQSLINLFAGAIPHDTQNQGNIVDIGEYTRSGNNAQSGVRRPIRKQPLLLAAPPLNAQDDQSSMASNTSPATPNINTQQQSQGRMPPYQTQVSDYSHLGASSSGGLGATQEINGQGPANSAAQTPRFTTGDNTGDSFPERDIMSLINSTNANDNHFLNNRMDFPEALSHLQTAGGKSPLTPHQRNNVLQLIANGGADVNTNGTNADNALTSSAPLDARAPDMSHWNGIQDDLDYLEKSLKEQDNKVASLSSMLQPLSPSGSIPGLTDPPGYGGPGTDPLDLDQIFNSGDYFNDTVDDANLNFDNEHADYTGTGDFNFHGYDGSGFANGLSTTGPSGEGGRIVETVDSSEATSPANTVEDGGGGDGGSSPRKRRRRN